MDAYGFLMMCNGCPMVFKAVLMSFFRDVYWILMELHGKIIELNEGLMARDLTFFGRSQGGDKFL